MKHQTTAHTRSDSTALVAVAAVSVQFVTNSLINQLHPHFLPIITSSNRHTAELRSCFVVCSLGPKLGRSTLLICELAAQTVALTPYAASPRLRRRAVHRAVRQVCSVLLLLCRALVARLRCSAVTHVWGVIAPSLAGCVAGHVYFAGGVPMLMPRPHACIQAR